MDGMSREYLFVAAHKPQLQVSGVPERYWSVLSKKLNDQIYDAGDAFALLLIDYEDVEKEPHDPTWSVQVVKENGIGVNDPTQIYLVDHAWTFRAHTARRQLRQIPGLLSRMINLVGLQAEERTEEEAIEAVFENVWKYAQFYSLRTQNITPEDSVPIWYVMDELGSGIQHSDEPNFKCVPFVHLPEGATYTLLFPLKNVKEGDTVTRNYIETPMDDEIRRAMLSPWQEFDCEDDDYAQAEPDSDYFLSGHIAETLPSTETEVAARDRSYKYKVYSEYPRINENLTNPRFELVDDESVADILWYSDHFKTYRELSENSPDKFVNQFPFENVITIKDLLSIVCRRKRGTPGDSLEDRPAWLPTTYNLKTELVQFVAYYRQRENRGLDNHWICKPFNLARGLDTYISDNLNFIVRLPLTGPKIAQKYIERPLLFARPDSGDRVKFDIRYVILLKSVKPLSVYVYKNFFLRFANRPFAMTNFDEYERHFTVMNYADNVTLFRMLCADYIVEWNKQYEDHPWSKVENDIMRMLKELFECATEKPPPCGIAPNRQSRALYAADIMLSWDKDNKENAHVQPKLLEVNWMPDCNRACQYYPDFYNDIFSLFFLDEEPETCKEI